MEPTSLICKSSLALYEGTRLILSYSLTGVTVLTERKIRKDFKGQVPTTVADFIKAYASSEIGQAMRSEVEEHLKGETQLQKRRDDLHEAVLASKQSSTRKNSPVMTGYGTQLKAAIKRDVQLRWADKPVLIIRLGSTLLLSFVYSTTYYLAPRSTVSFTQLQL